MLATQILSGESIDRPSYSYLEDVAADTGKAGNEEKETSTGGATVSGRLESSVPKHSLAKLFHPPSPRPSRFALTSWVRRVRLA